MVECKGLYLSTCWWEISIIDKCSAIMIWAYEEFHYEWHSHVIGYALFVPCIDWLSLILNRNSASESIKQKLIFVGSEEGKHLALRQSFAEVCDFLLLFCIWIFGRIENCMHLCFGALNLQALILVNVTLSLEILCICFEIVIKLAMYLTRAGCTHFVFILFRLPSNRKENIFMLKDYHHLAWFG